MKPTPIHRLALTAARSVACSWVALLATGAALAETPQSFLADYAQQAGAPGNATRGQQFFTSRHGGQWSCASCHGQQPTQDGRHASTGKLMAPLAPAANPQRFTDPRKVEKWFRRNCGDVLDRECTAQEKADVLAWLNSLR